MNETLQSSSREWKFSSMGEADAYLTSHGHPTILEIANKYLLSQGHPLICTERTAGATLPDTSSRSTGNGSLTGFQQYEQQSSIASMPSSGAHRAHSSQANFAFNTSPASVAGFARAEDSESFEVQASRRVKRKADADGDNNNGDGADMGAPLAKKSRASSVMIMMQATQQATPPRKGSAQSKLQKQTHSKQAGFGTRADGPPKATITENRVSQLDSGYHSPDAGFEGNSYEWFHASGAPITTEQVHSSTSIENTNLLEFQMFPAKNCGQMRTHDNTYHFSDEGNMGVAFENLDFGFPNSEFNSQHSGDADHSEFDFESLDLFLQSQEQAHDSNVESQNVKSTLQNSEKARDSDFDFGSLDRFLPNQAFGQGFELDSQNVNSASHVLEDEGVVEHSTPDLSDDELPLDNDENDPSSNDGFYFDNHPASLDNHPPSPLVKDY
jgi:hypothetical protein